MCGEDSELKSNPQYSLLINAQLSQLKVDLLRRIKESNYVSLTSAIFSIMK